MACARVGVSLFVSVLPCCMRAPPTRSVALSVYLGPRSCPFSPPVTVSSVRVNSLRSVRVTVSRCVAAGCAFLHTYNTRIPRFSDATCDVSWGVAHLINRRCRDYLGSYVPRRGFLFFLPFSQQKAAVTPAATRPPSTSADHLSFHWQLIWETRRAGLGSRIPAALCDDAGTDRAKLAARSLYQRQMTLDIL